MKLGHDISRLQDVDGVVLLCPSKSICIRTLVLQFLNRQPLSPLPPDAPADVVITHTALVTILHHLRANDEEEVRVDVGDCGAAYRFLTAVLAITPGRWWLTGTERLRERPITPLVHALQSVGAEVGKKNDGIHICGKLIHADEVVVDGQESSQYVSALLLIAPQMGNPAITYDKLHQRSSSYIKMTEMILKKFYEENEVVFERDWSAAIFWYAYLVLGGKSSILLKDLSLQSMQGDVVSAQWFTAMGIVSQMTDEGVVIWKKHDVTLEEATMDVRHHIDLAPVLVVMAAMLPMKLTLTGVQNLNLKESKRKDHLMQDLADLATLSSPDEDTLVVEGRAQKQCEELHLSSHQDHRLVMAYSLLKLRCRVKLEGAECVSKSYPGFEKDVAQWMRENQ